MCNLRFDDNRFCLRDKSVINDLELRHNTSKLRVESREVLVSLY